MCIPVSSLSIFVCDRLAQTGVNGVDNYGPAVRQKQEVNLDLTAIPIFQSLIQTHQKHTRFLLTHGMITHVIIQLRYLHSRVLFEVI